MITSYAILVTRLEQGGWLAQLCYGGKIIAEAAGGTQLRALLNVRRNADPWFIEQERESSESSDSSSICSGKG